MSVVKSVKIGILVHVLALVLAAAPAFSADRVLSADQAWRLAKKGDVTIVDVRSRREWRQTGVAAGAHRVTIHDPDGEQGFVREMSRALGDNLARPIALICARGNRSTRAVDILAKAGFTDLYNLREGMLGSGGARGWLAHGLPVERCAGC